MDGRSYDGRELRVAMAKYARPDGGRFDRRGGGGGGYGGGYGYDRRRRYVYCIVKCCLILTRVYFEKLLRVVQAIVE